MVLILIREVIIMFFFLAIGVLCNKKGILNEQSTRSLSNLLLMVVVPCLLIRSLQLEYRPALLPAMIATLTAAALFHLVSIFLIGYLVPDPGDGTARFCVTRLAGVFTNAAFMGFPLISAVLGETGLLYGVLFVGILNVVSWLWGAPLLDAGHKYSPRQLLTNPVILSVIASIILHMMPFRLPLMVQSMLGQMGALNTPLAMIITGFYLAEVRPAEILRDRQVYKLVFMRNILFPLITIGLLWAVRISRWLPGGRLWALAFVIAMSCPSGILAILLSTRYGHDSAHGSKLVSASTLSAVVTLPLAYLLADLLL